MSHHFLKWIACWASWKHRVTAAVTRSRGHSVREEMMGLPNGDPKWGESPIRKKNSQAQLFYGLGFQNKKKVENSFLISVSSKIMLGLTQRDKLTTVLTCQHLWKHWEQCPQRSVLLQTEVHWAPLTPMALISGETRLSTQIITALGRSLVRDPEGRVFTLSLCIHMRNWPCSTEDTGFEHKHRIGQHTIFQTRHRSAACPGPVTEYVLICFLVPCLN